MGGTCGGLECSITRALRSEITLCLSLFRMDGRSVNFRSAGSHDQLGELSGAWAHFEPADTREMRATISRLEQTISSQKQAIKKQLSTIRKQRGRIGDLEEEDEDEDEEDEDEDDEMRSMATSSLVPYLRASTCQTRLSSMQRGRQI